MRRRPDGSYLVDGTVPVRDLNRELDWNLPEEDATTVAGLVIAQSGTIPEVGPRFAFFGYITTTGPGTLTVRETPITAPEPTSCALLALAGAGLGLARRRE